ncbi:zinc finger protein 3 homolog isoform X5 [Hyperolius riggenbachi]|uniref:zinc finger protein 3 homolog isoform X5 n=1 Tax=Hyperolius riggenbachi TaxID=752182 RepID=UPI0035A26610
MENQPPLTSPEGSSNRSLPETYTGPLYSKDFTHEECTIPHHYQDEEHADVKAEIKEEEETYVRSDQQSVETGEIMTPIKEEEKYVRSDQQSVETGVIMTPIKEEETYVRSDQQSMETGEIMTPVKEEEKYVRSDQQSMEEGDMMGRIKKEEEEMFVRSDLQSMEERDMIGRIKEEEEETYVRGDQHSAQLDGDNWIIKKENSSLDSNADGQDVGSTSEGRLISPLDDTAEDNGVTQYSPGGNPITGNTHHRLYHEERSPDPSNPEESSDISHPITSNIHGRFRTKNHSNSEGSSGKSCFRENSYHVSHQNVHREEQPFLCSECGKHFINKRALLTHERIHTGERPFVCPVCGRSFARNSILVAHQRLHTEKSSLQRLHDHISEDGGGPESHG